MFSDEYDIQRSKINKSKREVRSVNNPATSFNIRQKLNFRYVPGEDQQQYGTFDTFREQLGQEETQRDIQCSNHINDSNKQIFIKESININNSVQDGTQNQFTLTQEEDQSKLPVPMTESIFNSPQNNQDFVFQSNIINSKNINFKRGWKDQGADTDSAGMSKTTLSTQRPMLSGGVTGIMGAISQQNQTNQNKLTSKIKMISYQKGRFSSDSSFIKLRQTQQHNNNVKHSTAIDGEDSQCKFEGDLDREEQQQKIRHDIYDQSKSQNCQRISNANNNNNNNLFQMQMAADMGVGYIQEEEEFVEDEDSKKSNFKMKEQSVASVISTNRILTAGQHNRKNYVENQSIILDESQCNLLNSMRTGNVSAEDINSVGLQNQEDLSNHKPNKITTHNKWLLENNESQQILQTHQIKRNQNEVLHSDDEIEIRRGLEPSTNRSLNPRDPEFLRQSTHSLLGIKRNAKNHEQISSSKHMIVDDYEDDMLRAQLDVDLDSEQICINQDEDDIEPISRLQLNNNSYENYLKNADNFIN